MVSLFLKKIFNFIKRFDEALEKEPLNRIIRRKQLFAYKHKKFWKCLDNNKDKIEFNKILKKRKKFG